ncbi:glycosyl hydrolase [Anaeromicropila populeti]|uniref:Mannan endo-1,4-beta-mannosidase n=1 Tax=Anaeromicropila populeti TaxID=37658 RepID=A0A1I6IEZ2_9FIRM|nr:glycosyl hydrolase [Anaeromicropila populeti]SFR64910.1 mannan endo-1,4-beta-mannosidase [Anaeromicropila populeti]
MKKCRILNPNISKEALQVYEYICGTYRNHIISGQQEDPREGCHDNEMEYIMEKTGKLPAIRGLDYIHNDFAGVNERAIKWWKEGGIVTICWHWGTPPNGIGYPSSQGSIDMEEALTEGTALHQAMLDRMDEAAEALKVLQDAKVPVLWRPLHEFDGAWFWWGKGGSECFIRLWRLLYERYTNYHHLNNLIWVLGYCGDVHNGWYPGDQYVDFIGADAYEEGIREEMYEKVAAIVGDEVPICYHENGPIPNPVQLAESKVPWAWFMTWHTIHIMEQNTPEYLREVYHNEYVITLDKLPSWT